MAKTTELTSRLWTSRIAKERGGAVQIVNQQITTPDGTMATALSIDLSDATVPDRLYYADLCDVVYDCYAVKLLFGQQRRGGGVRSMVEISMPPLSALNFLRLLDGLKDPSVAEILQMMGLQPGGLSDIKEDPKETVQFKANLATSAFFGTDSCLDFYSASAFTMGAIQLSGKPGSTANVLGVVRVETPAPVVAAMQEGIRKIIPLIPDKILVLAQITAGKEK